MIRKIAMLLLALIMWLFIVMLFSCSYRVQGINGKGNIKKVYCNDYDVRGDTLICITWYGKVRLVKPWGVKHLK